MKQAGKPLYARYQESRASIRIMAPVECAWLACAIDGEGTIGIYKSSPKSKNGRRAHIMVTNTDEAFVKYARQVVGNIGSIVRHYFYGGSLGHIGRKPIYNWQLNGSNRCYALLKQLLPYLIIKREKAAAIITEIDTYPFGRWSGQTEEGKQEQSRLQKESWRNPEIRQRRIEGMRRAFATKRAAT